MRVKNPHSILAALRHRPAEVVSIVLPAGPNPGEAWVKVEELARAHRIRMVSADETSGAASGKRTGPGGKSGGKGPSQARGGRDRVERPKDGRISMGEAVLQEKRPIAVERLLASAKGAQNGLWLALDTLQDPHNVGAIFRTASFFGVKGILLTEDRSAPLSGTVYDVSAGGVEAIPFAVETNLKRCLDLAKDAGLWVVGSSEHAKQDLGALGPDRAWLLVLGNEERGMRRLTSEHCDLIVQIPPVGDVTSLNVSVAAGVMISRLAPRP